MPVSAVVCYIINGKKVLLIRRAKNPGIGQLSGIGGRIEPGETPEQACSRETLEETGLRLNCIEQAGFFDVYHAKKTKVSGWEDASWRIFVFRSRDFSGRLKQSSEGGLIWASLDKLPLGEMWGHNKLWLPQVLAGKSLEASFFYDEDLKLANHKLRID